MFALNKLYNRAKLVVLFCLAPMPAYMYSLIFFAANLYKCWTISLDLRAGSQKFIMFGVSGSKRVSLVKSFFLRPQ